MVFKHKILHSYFSFEFSIITLSFTDFGNSGLVKFGSLSTFKGITYFYELSQQ